MVVRVEWVPTARLVDGSVRTVLRCPYCGGDGLSPYHDVDGSRSKCECCYGRGWREG